MNQLKGIDVSHHNGSIDWAKVRADGVQFAFIKATQGVGYSKVDYFRNNAPVALGNSIQVGAYHYAVFSTVPEALAEAKYFYSVIKDYKLTYPVVLDLEENKRNSSRKQLTDAAIAFMDFFKQKGYTPMLYTGKSFLESQLEESRIHYPLWIARYNKELGRTADIWQYSSEGRVNGINSLVDMNIAYRDFAAGKPYKVIIPNMAYWQAKALVSEYEKRGYKCQGVAKKVYNPHEHPQRNDPYAFELHATHEQAKQLVIELKTKGYDRTFGEEIK